MHPHETKKLLKVFEGCSRILDVGCGVGEFIGADPGRIEGVDITDESLEIAKKKGFTVRKADARKLPFKDGCFDGVNASHIIEHFQPEEAYDFLVELLRIAKRNGLVVIGTPLPHKRFYETFSHIKTYLPRSFESLQKGSPTQASFPKLDIKVEKIIYRFGAMNRLGHLFRALRLYSLADFLAQVGINRDGYIIVIRKLK